MTGAQDTIDHEAFEAQCRAGIEAWVAEHLGGEVVAMERLERWRPQWKVSYTCLLLLARRVRAPERSACSASCVIVIETVMKGKSRSPRDSR